MAIFPHSGVKANPALQDQNGAYVQAHSPSFYQLALRNSRQILRQLRLDLYSDRIMLVPVRAFIGLGWLRASAEKLLDPGWMDGSSLTGFLTTQLAAEQVVFPFYEELITMAFLPHAELLSWIVLIGQLLAGLAILLGSFTTLALLGGMFMNLNFLLAGMPNPNVFYLVIQIVLLLTHTGAVLGLDSWLGRTSALAWLSARPTLPTRARRVRLWPQLALTAVFLVVAGAAATAISDFSPAGSVHDPAMILVILALMLAGWSGLGYLRAALAPVVGEAIS